MPNRISGKLGQITVPGDTDSSPVIIGLIFDWTIEFSQEAAECGIKGEIAEAYALGVFTGRLTAQRFATDATADSKLAAQMLLRAATAGGILGGQRISFTAEQIAGAGSKVRGSGYITRSGLTSPRQMALDTFEVVLDAIPTIS